MKVPENIKELQTFLGFITYLQKFMPDMSEISSPLRILLQKHVELHWDSKQQESFSKLKLINSQTPVLTFYDKDKELTLNVDSSSCGLGAVLLQEGKPIAYASRALNSTRRKCAQREKETLVIVFVVKNFTTTKMEDTLLLKATINHWKVFSKSPLLIHLQGYKDLL